jgi:hypothetical protein
MSILADGVEVIYKTAQNDSLCDRQNKQVKRTLREKAGAAACNSKQMA